MAGRPAQYISESEMEVREEIKRKASLNKKMKEIFKTNRHYFTSDEDAGLKEVFTAEEIHKYVQ